MAFYTLHGLAYFMRKWPVFFAGFCRKALCKGKIKNFIFSAHNKIVQTDLMLSVSAESGISFSFADIKAKGDKLEKGSWRNAY